MNTTEVNKIMTWITSFFYYAGIWHRGDKPTINDIRNKLCHGVFYSFFPLALISGAIGHEKIAKSIFLAEISIATVFALIKFLFLMWKQNRITDLLHRVCVVDIQDNDDYAMFNSKTTKFAQLGGMYVAVTCFGAFLVSVIPFSTSGHTLFYEIGFPLDYRNSETAFYIAATFVSIETCMAPVITSFSVITYFLLYTCSVRIEVLVSELKNMGRKKRLHAEQEEENHAKYRNDLHMSIDAHLSLRELTIKVGSFFSGLFLIQFATSSVCICGSIYCIAFDIAESFLERVMYCVIVTYFIGDIFMATYFANEITISYNRLSYSLFESNWTEQSQSTKRSVLIFGEFLQKPLTLMIGKLFPLTLETFNQILNGAYRMFNILQNFQN